MEKRKQMAYGAFAVIPWPGKPWHLKNRPAEPGRDGVVIGERSKTINSDDRTTKTTGLAPDAKIPYAGSNSFCAGIGE